MNRKEIRKANTTTTTWEGDAASWGINGGPLAKAVAEQINTLFTQAVEEGQLFIFTDGDDITIDAHLFSDGDFSISIPLDAALAEHTTDFHCRERLEQLADMLEKHAKRIRNELG